MYVAKIYQTESGPVSNFRQGIRYMFDTPRLKHSVFMPSRGLFNSVLLIGHIFLQQLIYRLLHMNISSKTNNSRQ